MFSLSVISVAFQIFFKHIYVVGLICFVFYYNFSALSSRFYRKYRLTVYRKYRLTVTRYGMKNCNDEDSLYRNTPKSLLFRNKKEPPVLPVSIGKIKTCPAESLFLPSENQRFRWCLNNLLTFSDGHIFIVDSDAYHSRKPV